MEDRFWAKVDTAGDCWLWTGSTNNHGYGQLRAPDNGVLVYAHRYSAMIHFGMFDRRAVVCHHCDTPNCVRPSHLFVGSMKQNSADMVAKGRQSNQRKTHCPQGHEYTPENTYRLAGRTSRYCCACKGHKPRVV